MITFFLSILTTFEAKLIFEAAGGVAKTGLSLKSNQCRNLARLNWRKTLYIILKPKVLLLKVSASKFSLTLGL
jgi:hypothetical protein